MTFAASRIQVRMRTIVYNDDGIVASVRDERLHIIVIKH